MNSFFLLFQGHCPDYTPNCLSSCLKDAVSNDTEFSKQMSIVSLIANFMNGNYVNFLVKYRQFCLEAD